MELTQSLTAVGAEVAVGGQGSATVGAEGTASDGTVGSVAGTTRIGATGVGDFVIVSCLNEAEVQGVQSAAADNKDEQNQTKQNTDEGDQGQQGQDQGDEANNQGQQNVRQEHLALPAMGALGGFLDGFGSTDFGFSDQDVGGQTVFIDSDDGNDGADERNQAPQEDPQQHPQHTSQDTLGGSAVFEAVEQIDDMSTLTAVAVEEDHGHGGGQQQIDAQCQTGNNTKHCSDYAGQNHMQKRNTPKCQGLLHQDSQRAFVNCKDHL